MPQIPQNNISQNTINHYNKFISFITEALRWLKTITDTRKKLKVESKVKERYQQQLEFITIDVIKVDKKNSRPVHYYSAYDSNHQRPFLHSSKSVMK